MNLTPLLARLRPSPLRISMTLAVLAVSAHLTIELGSQRTGLFSPAGFIHQLELKALDQKLRSRGMELPDEGVDVVIAAVDERSVEAYGLWPWSRQVIADFLNALEGKEARAVAFDAVFSDRDRAGDTVHARRLVDAYRDARLTTHAGQLEAKADGDPALRGLLQRLKRYNSVVDEIAGARTPDEALAEAIAGRPEAILGYFHFVHADEVVGLDAEEIARDKATIASAGIEDVYTIATRKIDQRVHRMVVPLADGTAGINALDIPTSVAVQAPLPEFAAKAGGFAFFNAPKDPDGMVRRLPLFSKRDGKLFPSLSLLSAATALGTDIRPEVVRDGDQVRLAGVVPLEPGQTDRIPTNAIGQLLLNHYGDPRRVFPQISVVDIIDGKVTPEKLKGKVVLFGLTAIGLDMDLVATAFSPATPGVYVHATAIQNILDGRHLVRWPGQALLESLVMLLVGLALGLMIPRLSVGRGLLATLGLLVLFYVADLMGFLPAGVWVASILPTTQILGTFMGISVHGYMTEGREKAKIRSAFQFYLNKNVIDEMLQDTSRLKLGGERRVCTVLFSDIRDFTTLSERLSPEALVQLLNSYLTPMTNIILRYDGTVDKYIGDAIMAIFGAPANHTDHARRACLAALDMRSALKTLCETWREEGLPELAIGVGLNTGSMSVGNMGSTVRFTYTAMGDHVNLASRLEGINKVYGTDIIVSSDTLADVGEGIVARELDLVRVKGRVEPVRIYELRGHGACPTDERHAIDTFESALHAYRQQDWDTAAHGFTQVHTGLLPGDAAAQMFLSRCEAMRQSPPPEAWDGVFVMTTK